MKKISTILDTICGALIVVLLAALVIVVTVQILWRTFFTAIPWTEEVTRYLLIWSTYLGATCVYFHSGNIAITALQGLMPAKVRKCLRVLVHAVCLVLFVVLSYYAIRYCSMLKKTTTALPVKLPMKNIYAVMPVSLVIMAWHALVLMLEEIFHKDEAEVKG